MKNYKKPTLKVQRRMEEKMKSMAKQKARENKEMEQMFFILNSAAQIELEKEDSY